MPSRSSSTSTPESWPSPAVRFEAPLEHQAGIGRLAIDRPDDAVNAVSPGLVEDLGAAVRAARACQGLAGLIVVSQKKDQWVAGADLKMVTQAGQPIEVERAIRRFQAVLDEMAWLPFTTVAAINGPALGGGFELALACDYRVAVDAPSVSVGSPEVSLGLVPGGGATQRLPRLVGLRRGLDLLLSGRRLSAHPALRAGLLDEVVHPGVLEQAARAWAARPKRSLDRRLMLGPGLQAAADLAELTPLGRQLMYRQARQAVLSRTHGQYPAPVKALEAVKIGFERGMAAGLDAEARAFVELAFTSTARNLIWLFLATQHQKRLAARDTSAVARLGVVGAGFMGAAIAEVGAAAGVSVRVRDVQPEALARGLARIRGLVDAGLARGRFDRREAEATLQRVSGTTDYSGFASADVVIEAVFEDLPTKRKVIEELEAVLRPEAVIASNTSALPIKDIAQRTRHPERVVGMHFFSPAERMPLLEVIRPEAAADWAVHKAVALGTSMGKTVVVVADRPGFYTSRILGVMLNEAATLLEEGASIEEVDAAMNAFGFPVGPFVVYDEVGLEVAQHVAETFTGAFADRLRPAVVLSRMVSAGLSGRKAGAGFYVWRKPPRIGLPGPLKRPARVPNPAVYGMVAPPVRRRFEQQAIQDRLALLFIDEAIRCLEEGVVQTPTDGDLAAVLGLGFPPFKGGPFHHADSVGLDELARQLRALAAHHGNRYEPSRLLIERARDGSPFFPE